MLPKTIALPINPLVEHDTHVVFALDLAKSSSAHVMGIVLHPEQIMPMMGYADVPVSMIEGLREQSDKAVATAVAAIEAKAGEAGVAISVRSSVGSLDALTAAFSSLARTCDLTVLAQSDPDHQSPLTNSLVEAALFSTGRPMLIVPYAGAHHAQAKHVIIGWDGGMAAARASHDAVSLAEAASVVEIVTIDTGHLSPAVEASAKDLCEAMKRRGIPAQVHVLPSGGTDPGNSILSHAADSGADLLVMGGYGHSRVREFIWGGATRSILATMTLPVLMAH